MFTASSSRALSARAAVVERLRRVLFSPQRLLTAGTLACVLACGGYAGGEDIVNNDMENVVTVTRDNIDDTLVKKGAGAVELTMSDPLDGVSTITGALQLEEGDLTIATNGEVVYNDITIGAIDPSTGYTMSGGYLVVKDNQHTVDGNLNIIAGELNFSPASENAKLTLNGDIALGDANNESTYGTVLTYGNVEINGALDINRGNVGLYMNADTTTTSKPATAIINNDVTLDNISSFHTFGNFNFTGDLTLNRGSSANVYSTSGDISTLTGSVSLNEYSSLTVCGQTQFLGLIEANGQSHVAFVADEGTGLAEITGSIIIDNSYFYAQDNVNLKGNLLLGNKSEGTIGGYAAGVTSDYTNTVNVDGYVWVDDSELKVQDNVNITGYLKATNGSMVTIDATEDQVALATVTSDTFIDASGLVATGRVDFQGNLYATNDSVLGFMGDNVASTLQGNAVLDNSQMLAHGMVDIKNNFTLQNGSAAQFDAQGKKITFSGGTLTVDNSTFLSYSNVDYQGNLVFMGNSVGVFSRVDENDSNTFGDNSTLTINKGSLVLANASQLKVDITLDGGELYFANLNQASDAKGYDDKSLVSYDENQTPTYLTYDNGRANIDEAKTYGNVIDHDIAGSGWLTFNNIADITTSSETAGYTVVIDSSKAQTTTSPMFQYTGNTAIWKAFVAIEGGTNFGEKGVDQDGKGNRIQVVGDYYDNLLNIVVDDDNMPVRHESGNYIFAEGAENERRYFSFDKNNKPVEVTFEKAPKLHSYWEVQSTGMLGFYRNNAAADVAPSVTASEVTFFNGKTLGELNHTYSEDDISRGARIWIDTSYDGEEKEYKLGAINADKIYFESQTDIWYDKISTVAPDKNMTFELNAPNVEVHVAGKDAETVTTTLNDVDAIQNVFAKPLVNAQVNPNFNPDGNAVDGYTVVVNARKVEEFAGSENLGQAEIDYAKKFDKARLDPEGNYATNVEFNDALYNENDGEKVKQTIRNLSLLGHSMLNMHSHVGNPSSAFFGGAALSAATKRGQDAQNDAPLADLPQESAINNNEKEQEEYNPTRGLWASFTHTSVEGDTYQDRGMTMHGYDLQRSGIIGGMKRQYDATLSGGLFFGLTLPEIESNAAEKSSGASVYTKMEMTDFQFAGHLEKIIADNWELCLFVGGGHQSMDWERTVNQKYRYTADSTGNTLTGTAYLAYRIDMNDRWTIRPTVGLDSEHSWLYNFTEDDKNGYGSLDEVGYANQILAQRYHYDNTYYNRNLARVGFTTAFDGAQGWAGLNARAFYSTQLGGKPAPLLTYNTVGGDVDLQFDDMGSHVMGSDAFSVGGGGYMHLNKTKTLTANGDINAIWYKNASTLNVTGGVSYRF